MRPTNTQLRHIEELTERVLTRQGADQLIRALLYLDGEKHVRADRAIAADPDLVTALEPHSERSGLRRLFGDPEPIGAMILAYRQGLGMSQDDLAARIGVTGAAVGYWEAAKTTPRPGLLPALARMLGVNLRVLELARERQIKETRGAA